MPRRSPKLDSSRSKCKFPVLAVQTLCQLAGWCEHAVAEHKSVVSAARGYIMKSPTRGEAKVSVLVCPERLLQELGDWSDACRGFGVWEDLKVIASSPQIIWFHPPPLFFFFHRVSCCFLYISLYKWGWWVVSWLQSPISLHLNLPCSRVHSLRCRLNEHCLTSLSSLVTSHLGADEAHEVRSEFLPHGGTMNKPRAKCRAADAAPGL